MMVCSIIMNIYNKYDANQSTFTQIKIRLKDSRYCSDRFCWKKWDSIVNYRKRSCFVGSVVL